MSNFSVFLLILVLTSTCKSIWVTRSLLKMLAITTNLPFKNLELGIQHTVQWVSEWVSEWVKTYFGSLKVSGVSTKVISLTCCRHKKKTLRECFHPKVRMCEAFFPALCLNNNTPILLLLFVVCCTPIFTCTISLSAEIITGWAISWSLKTSSTCIYQEFHSNYGLAIA